MRKPVRFPTGVSTAAKGSTLELYPAPDPTKVYTFFEDFTNYVAADWTITNTQACTEALVANEPFGALIITNTTADNDVCQLQKVEETFTIAVGKKAWFKTRFKINETIESDVNVGLIVLDASLVASAPTDGIFFTKADGAATVVATCRSAATVTTVSTSALATMVDDTYIVLGWFYDGLGEVKCFVNDVHIASMTTPSTIIPNEPITVTFGLQQGEATNAKTATIDYLFAAVER